MIGKKIQNYEISAHLGEGGMGTVYRASDTMLGRDVALKMLHAPLLQQSQFLERFKKEARVLAQLLHPNIAVIYNLVEQEGNQYMVMEYVEGKNFDNLLRQHRVLSHKLVVPAFIQALEGLRHAHIKGIFHRDIKPANLMLTPDGTVKIMDFGIARVAGEQRLTQVNRVVGTIEYMAPELIQGLDPSIASDVYAMGITMYELLTGKLPFEGSTDFHLMQDILKKKPVAPVKMNASVPPALNNIVMKAIEKKPEHRYANAKEMQQALAGAFPELVSADLSITYQPPPTAFIQVSSRKITGAKPTVEQGLQTRPISTIGRVVAVTMDKLRLKQNRPYLIGALSLLLLLVVAFSVFSGNNTSGNQDLKRLGMKDSSLVKKKNIDTEKERGSYTPDPVRQVFIPPLETTDEESKDEENKEKNEESKKKEKKKTEDKKPVNEDDDQEEQKKESDIKIPDVPVVKVDKTDEKKDRRKGMTIQLTTAPEVSLFLREAINASSVSEGQKLYFSVLRSVFYDGEEIVEKGAVATGRIKNKGNKKLSIVISSVMAANGKIIPFQEVELSGRIDDMVSNRNYSVSLKKGTVINF